jgi:hypothetical protein
MKLTKAYSIVIKYGRAPSEDIQTFVKAAGTAEAGFGGSHPDLAFADFLQDHDDPRHLIVRRDLEYRNAEQRQAFLEAYQKHLVELVGEKHNFPSGKSNNITPLDPDTKSLYAYTLKGDKGKA